VAQEYFFFSSRRRHTRFSRDWSSDVCSSDLERGRSVSKRGSFLARKSRAVICSVKGMVIQEAWMSECGRLLPELLQPPDDQRADVLYWVTLPGKAGRLATEHGPALGAEDFFQVIQILLNGLHVRIAAAEQHLEVCVD